MGYFLSLCSPNPSWVFADKKLFFLVSSDHRSQSHLKFQLSDWKLFFGESIFFSWFFFLKPSQTTCGDVGAVWSFFFFYQQLFFIFFSHITQHPKYNKTKQQTHTQHLKVQSKGRERGKDNKNTKVTPLHNHVYLTKNTAKHQWSRAWPHRLAPLYIHMTLLQEATDPICFLHMCGVNQFCILSSSQL